MKGGEEASGMVGTRVSSGQGPDRGDLGRQAQEPGLGSNIARGDHGSFVITLSLGSFLAVDGASWCSMCTNMPDVFAAGPG